MLYDKALSVTVYEYNYGSRPSIEYSRVQGYIGSTTIYQEYICLFLVIFAIMLQIICSFSKFSVHDSRLWKFQKIKTLGAEGFKLFASRFTCACWLILACWVLGDISIAMLISFYISLKCWVCTNNLITITKFGPAQPKCCNCKLLLE